MDMLLGGPAFAGLMVAQLAAVIAVNAERRREQTDDRVATPAVRTDPRARAIWELGGM